MRRLGGFRRMWVFLVMTAVAACNEGTTGATGATGATDVPPPPAPPSSENCADCGPTTCWVSPEMPGCPAARACDVGRVFARARLVDDAVDAGSDGAAADAGGADEGETVEIDVTVTAPSSGTKAAALSVATPTCENCALLESSIGSDGGRVVVRISPHRSTTMRTALVRLAYACSVNTGAVYLELATRFQGVKEVDVTVRSSDDR